MSAYRLRSSLTRDCISPTFLPSFDHPMHTYISVCEDKSHRTSYQKQVGSRTLYPEQRPSIPTSGKWPPSFVIRRSDQHSYNRSASTSCLPMFTFMIAVYAAASTGCCERPAGNILKCSFAHPSQDLVSTRPIVNLAPQDDRKSRLSRNNTRRVIQRAWPVCADNRQDPGCAYHALVTLRA
jgi:hypothetical protein